MVSYADQEEKDRYFVTVRLSSMHGASGDVPEVAPGFEVGKDSADEAVVEGLLEEMQNDEAEVDELESHDDQAMH